MNLLKKPWFATVILVIAVASSIAIGLAKHESRVINNDKVFDSTDLDTNLSLGYSTVKDSEKMLSEDAEEKVQIFNANWQKEYGTIVYLATKEEISSKDREEFAREVSYEIEGVFTDNDAIFILLEDSDDFLLYMGKDCSLVIDQDRANELRSLVKAAYNNDLEAGIIKVYNQLSAYLKEGSEETSRAICCFVGKSDEVTYFEVEKEAEDKSDIVISSDDIKNLMEKYNINWKVIIFALVVVCILFGRKKK